MQTSRTSVAAFRGDRSLDRRAARTGVTLIEVLVVISIISLLVALLLPAVMSSRAAARRVQCLNNLRNLGIAMTAEAHAKGRLPASGNFDLLVGGPDGLYHSWVVNLLPWLDRNDLFREWDLDLPSTHPQNQAVARIYVPVLACPEDITVMRQGDLSYVVNGGFGWTRIYQGVGDCPVGPDTLPIDFNADGLVCPPDPADEARPTDRRLFFRTGLFFIENWPPGTGTVRYHSLDTIVDGLSQTILLTENVRAGHDPFAPEVTWASPQPVRNSFFLSPGICLDRTCAEGNVDYRRANGGPGGINSGLYEAEGEAPWPASFHAGGVHIVLADGRAQFLSEQVDGAVYAALVSPQGSLIEGPLRQRLVSEMDY